MVVIPATQDRGVTMYSHDVVCARCRTALKVETQGVLVVEMASFGPYKVWNADLYKYPGCGYEVVTGFGAMPIRSDHYTAGFAEWLAKAKAEAPAVIYCYEHPNRITITVRQSRN